MGVTSGRGQQRLLLGEVFAFEVGHCQEDGHDNGGEHLEVIRLQAQQNDEIIHDLVGDAAADYADQADDEIGLDLQRNGEADENRRQTDDDGAASIVDVG